MIENKPELLKFYTPDGPERVGYIFFNEIVEVKNVAPDPIKGFLVDPDEVLKMEELGAQATWHTHPGSPSNLSGDDYKVMRYYPDMVHYIIGCDGIRAYQYDRVRKAVMEL